MNRAVGASQRIFELLDSKSEIQLNPGFKPQTEADDLKSFDGSMVFNNVTFCYPTRPHDNVLKDISINIEKGKMFALVGPSGAGKFKNCFSSNIKYLNYSIVRTFVSLPFLTENPGKARESP